MDSEISHSMEASDGSEGQCDILSTPTHSGAASPISVSGVSDASTLDSSDISGHPLVVQCQPRPAGTVAHSPGRGYGCSSNSATVVQEQTTLPSRPAIPSASQGGDVDNGSISETKPTPKSLPALEPPESVDCRSHIASLSSPVACNASSQPLTPTVSMSDLLAQIEVSGPIGIDRPHGGICYSSPESPVSSEQAEYATDPAHSIERGQPRISGTNSRKQVPLDRHQSAYSGPSAVSPQAVPTRNSFSGTHMAVSPSGFLHDSDQDVTASRACRINGSRGRNTWLGSMNCPGGYDPDSVRCPRELSAPPEASKAESSGAIVTPYSSSPSPPLTAPHPPGPRFIYRVPYPATPFLLNRQYSTHVLETTASNETSHSDPTSEASTIIASNTRAFR